MPDDAARIRNALSERIREGMQFAGKRAFIYGCIYYSTKASLITLSALTSAKALGNINFIEPLQGWAALAVTIIAGLDTWLKPSIKYSAYYEYDDEFRRIDSDLVTITSDDPKQIEKLVKIRSELERIRERHRKLVFP